MLAAILLIELEIRRLALGQSSSSSRVEVVEVVVTIFVLSIFSFRVSRILREREVYVNFETELTKL